MKQTVFITACTLLLTAWPLWAAQPTNINYAGKGATLTGTAYRIYTVRCSDGTKRDITSWNGENKWCQGKGSDSKCSESQLKAATSACK